MLTLAMLLAVRRLLSPAEPGSDGVAAKSRSEHLENRKDAKRPRFKVKKKNLERIFRIERRMDVWEDVALELDPRTPTEDHCALRQCASSTQTNAAPSQSVTSMQTDSVVVCSLAVQTQWIATPTTLNKLRAELPRQRDSSLQTATVGVSISVQTETQPPDFVVERIDVCIQTEHRVFVFQTVSMQTEARDLCESAFQTDAFDEEEFAATLQEIPVEKAVKVDNLQSENVTSKFATIQTQTGCVEPCDVGSQTCFAGTNASNQTDCRVVVFETNWVQTEQAAKCDNSVQTETIGRISETAETQEFAFKTDESEKCDATSQADFVGSSVALQTGEPSSPDLAFLTRSVAQRDEANQTAFAGKDVSGQTEPPTLPSLATQTDAIETTDASLQTHVSGNIENKEFSTQTEAVSKRDASLQTFLADSQSSAIQTDRPELPNLATQTDLIVLCDTAFQTDFLGNNVSVQTVIPEFPNLATQTDIVPLCHTALQTEYLGYSVSVQTVMPTNPVFTSQTESAELCNISVQTAFNDRAISVQTEPAQSTGKWTQTVRTAGCDGGSQTDCDARSVSSQTEQRNLQKFSMQTEKAARCEAGLQTDFVGDTVSTQTVQQARPTFSMQTTRALKSDSVVQTNFAGTNVCVQTIKPISPSFSMQTEEAVHFARASQTEFLANDASIQTEILLSPSVSWLAEVDKMPRRRSQTEFGKCASMQTEILMSASFSTQTDLVVKSESALQPEVIQRSIAVQTIKPKSPTFSVHAKQNGRHNRSSQTELVERCTSLPALPTYASSARRNPTAHRSCQTDFNNSGWMSHVSPMNLSNVSAASEFEEFQLKRIKATYSTCTAEEQAHYLGALAEKLLKWHDFISFPNSFRITDKISSAEKALLEIEQELQDCPIESGKRSILASAKERVRDCLRRLNAQRIKYCDKVNKTL